MASPPPPTLHGVLPAGTILAGYELKAVLGQGAFGITYRARDLTLHRDIALKEYLPTSLALRDGLSMVVPRSPDHAEQFAWGCERFLEEARTLARLDRTPAIVRVHGFFEANGTAYMVMALIEGETLNRRLLREQRLAPDAIDRLLFSLLDGLEEIHAIGFLHRDIKPANIMVDSYGRPTLIDFGASRAAMAKRSTTLTAIFTPGYAAAEQFSSEALGPWTDIYGLAATLYHAITGHIPPSSIDRILNDTYRPLTELQPEGHVPAILAAIDSGLALRVDARPQSVAEWRQMLRPSLVLEATHIARKSGPLMRAASRARRTGVTIKGPMLWTTTAVVAALLAGGGYLALNAGSETTVSTAALRLSAEQLEQALAERRKADALVTEKRQLEENARQKAETEAIAKRLADLELEAAREARQKAERELARLKADIELRRQADTRQSEQTATIADRAAEEAAQHKAETEAAALRKAEADATAKAIADAAAKEHADRELALAEAQREQAEAEARAKVAVESAEEKAAAAEKSLRLQPADRERVQVALTTLGFDTRAPDGVFGPRSRDMIARWQRARKQMATGFLTRQQQEMLLAEAAMTPSKSDGENNPQETAKPVSQQSESADGPWHGTYECGRNGNFRPLTLNMFLRLIDGSGTWYATSWSPTNDYTVGVKVSVNGSNVTATRAATFNTQVTGTPTPLQGRFDGTTIRASDNACTMVLTRGLPAKTIAAPMQRPEDGPKSPSLPSPDGSWRGAYKCGQGPQMDPAFNTAFVIDLKLQFANGSAIWRPLDPVQNNGYSLDVAVSVVRDTASVARTMLSRIGGLGSPSTLTGRYDGSTINVTGQERSSGRDCTLTLTRS